MGEKPAVRRALGALIVIVFLAGLAGAATEGTGPGGHGDPLELVMAAADSTERARTGRYEMSMSFDVGGTRMEARATGAFDEGAGVLTTEMSIAGNQVETVVSPGAVYVRQSDLHTDDGAPGWIRIEGPAAETDETDATGGFLDPGAMLGSLREVGDIEVVGSEDLRGTNVTHYRAVLEDPQGRTDLDATATLFLAVGMAEVEMEVDAWIDGEGIAHRVEQRMSTTMRGQQPTEVLLRMDLLDLGLPVKIELPPDEVVVAVERADTPEDFSRAMARVLPGFAGGGS